MSKRNSRAAKEARRKEQVIREHMRNVTVLGAATGWDPSRAGEIGVEGGRSGCPEVPRVPVPLEEMMKRPGAVRMQDKALPPGIAAAVKWWCKDGCGQDHISVWADLG
jgi:hypothetical protein